MKFIHSLLLLAALPLCAQQPPMSPDIPPPPGPGEIPASSPRVVYVPIRPEDLAFMPKRARILLAEERRDPALLDSLYADSDELIRSRAARAAGRIGAPGAAARLALLLDDPAPAVRGGAAWGALYLGEAGRPLLPALRKLLSQSGAVRQPVLETVIALNDAESAETVVNLLGQNPDLASPIAGHLFRLDAPKIRLFLRTLAQNAANPGVQYGAIYSMVRLKIEDEAFYRSLLGTTIGETAVVTLKGLGMTKTLSAESLAAIEAVAKREKDPLVRVEAWGLISRADLDYAKKSAPGQLFRGSDAAQLALSIMDNLAKLECPEWASSANEILELNASGLDHCYMIGEPWKCLPAPALQRRYVTKFAACTDGESNQGPSQTITEFNSIQHDANFRIRAAYADALPENKNDAFVRSQLSPMVRDADPRIRASAAAALVSRGDAVTPFLADPEPEVVANVADAAAKWKIFPKEKITASALAKAYDRFNAKDAPDGPTARLYLVRLAAACASTQSGCKALLARAIAKDRERAVQLDGWSRWPAKLKGKPDWPQPNLPPPDYATAEGRLAMLVQRVPRFEVETTQGKFTMAFTARGESPLNVLNFRDLVAKKFFDGISWHRVVPNFVVQGGDPRGDGSGGPGHLVPCEYNSYPYIAGTVGMALDGKDTGGSQFFVALTRVPHLDYHYTVLGQIEAGMEVLYKLGEDDKIISIRELEP